MAQKAKNTSQPEGSLPKEKTKDVALWRRRGVEDVYFQREAQVNLWTVLGGLAVAALLTQLPALIQEVEASRWYLGLYLLASIAAIVNSWAQTSWASLILHWPISIPVTTLIFLTQFSLAIQCLLITNPMGWMAASGAMILFTLIHNYYNRTLGSWNIFSPERIKGLKTGLRVYIFWLFLCIGGTMQLYWFPSRLSEMIWGFVVLTSSVIALIMQHQTMEKERKELGVP